MLTISNLRYTQQKLRPKYVGDLGDAFALRWLETEHGVPRERAVNQVAFGNSRKLGVHGFHLEDTKNTLILFVCNPSKYVNDFAEPLKQLSNGGLRELFAAQRDSTGDFIGNLVDSGFRVKDTSRFLLQFISVLEESKPIIKNINIRLLFFGDVGAAAEAAIVKNFREDVLHLRSIIEARLDSPEVAITCTVKSADGSSSVPDKLKGYRHRILLGNHVKTVGPSGEVIHIGTVSLKELLDIYRKLGIRFLARNVRAALNASTGSNQALSRAFYDVVSGDSSPELFLFRHNGVTLTASFCQSEDGTLELVEPQLLNGAQTVTTLHSVCEELKRKDGYSKAIDARLAKLFVIGRVITNAASGFVTSVTIASNRQNPIMPWHLRAHDDVQSRLQAWFSDHLGLYYEVQEGAFNSMTEEELEWHGVLESDKCLEIRKLAQTFLAAEGYVDKMQQLKIVFEDDVLYARTFCPGRMKASPQDVVFCYKIERRIKKILRLLGGSEKYAFVKGARSLIWALLCQAYLNDRKRDGLADKHGRNLVATEDFTGAIERLAESRVKPLLMWVVNESDYAEDVRAERYGFLGTRKVFERTMEVARSNWDWQHRRLGACE